MVRMLLNAAALADYLGCSLRHVRRLDRRGALPRIEVGRLVRYDAEEVLRALKREPVNGRAHRVHGRWADIPHRGGDVSMVGQPLHYMDRHPCVE